MIVHKNLVELMNKLLVLEKCLASLLEPIKNISYLIDRWWLVCARIPLHLWNIETMWISSHVCLIPWIAQYLTVLECLSVFCLSCLDKYI